VVALSEQLPVAHVWLRGRRSLLPSYSLLMLAGALSWYLWRTDTLFPAGLVVLFGVAAVYRSARYTVLMQQQTVDALAGLADLMDQRDYYTHQHSLRVGQYAERLAAALGLAQRDAWLIFLCGRLHDIGKCAVSNDILLKPGPLTPDERLEMSRHAAIGGRMLAHFDQFKVGAAYVRGHHEWYDGRGYPDGLARGQIPLGARIIAVADAYDAMTTDRPYRQGLPKAEAIRRLQAGAGTQWDPRVVQAFVGLLGPVPPSKPWGNRWRSPELVPTCAGAPIAVR
jgi:HD-GYP domain-containing protein (c-di-GMP phosphodiesterase class II)